MPPPARNQRPPSSYIRRHAHAACAHCRSQSPEFRVDLLVTGDGSGESYKEQCDRLIPHLTQIGWKVYISPIGWMETLCPVCWQNEIRQTHIEVYEPAAECPKCGCPSVSIRFCTGLTPDCPRTPGRDHLHRTCQTCRYDWLQNTKDHKIAHDPKWEDVAMATTG